MSYKTGSSWRNELLHNLARGPVKSVLLLLVLVDVLIVIISSLCESAYKDSLIKDYSSFIAECRNCKSSVTSCDDPHFGNDSLHESAKVLAVISVGILSIFLFENLLLAIALRCRFLNKETLTDLAVILVSLACEILAITETANIFPGGLIVIGRALRFYRVVEAAELLEEKLTDTSAPNSPVADGVSIDGHPVIPIDEIPEPYAPEAVCGHFFTNTSTAGDRPIEVVESLRSFSRRNSDRGYVTIGYPTKDRD